MTARKKQSQKKPSKSASTVEAKDSNVASKLQENTLEKTLETTSKAKPKAKHKTVNATSKQEPLQSASKSGQKDLNTKSSPAEIEANLLTPSVALSRIQADALVTTATDQSAAYEQVRYGFTLGPIGVFTPVGMISEVLDLQRIYVLPNTAAWLLGLINLRGNLVPVFDLGRLLNIKDNTGATGASDNNQAEQHILIIGSGKQALALIIDDLPQPITSERQQTEMPPISDYAKNFVSQAYSFQQRIWVDLDLETYLMSLREQLAVA